MSKSMTKMETVGEDDLRGEIAATALDLASAEQLVSQLRRHRDNLFVNAYDARAITVTEMGRLSGLRRESVHDAINRTRGDV